MAVIFVSGIFIGTCGTGYFIKSRFGKMRHGTVAEKYEHIMKILRWKLNLSAEQEERIGPIVLKAAGEFDSIHANVKPEISSILQDTISEINQELTSKQQKNSKNSTNGSNLDGNRTQCHEVKEWICMKTGRIYC